MSRMMIEALREGAKRVAEDTPAWLGKILESVDMENSRLSMKDLRNFVYAEARKREATPSSALGQLLRADTQRIADGWFQDPANDEKSFTVIPAQGSSNKAEEFYNPLHSAVIQSETAQGAPYTEGQVVGEDIVIPNRKFMGGESFTRELFDDDKTGQIRDRQRKLAEAMTRTVEVYFALAYPGAGGTFGAVNGVGLVVGADPWPTLPTSLNQFGNTVTGIFTVAGPNGLGNRVAVFGQLSTPLLKEVQDLADQMVDRQGNIVAVQPDTLFISTKDKINAKVIAHSASYPTVQGLSGETFNTATSGIAPSGFAMNPWQGAFKIVVNRYLAAWSCYYVQAGRGFVYQVRDGFEVAQEAPLSGKSFDTDAIRLRTRARWAQRWVDPRFAIQINDGSSVGSF